MPQARAQSTKPLKPYIPSRFDLVLRVDWPENHLIVMSDCYISDTFIPYRTSRGLIKLSNGMT